MEATASSSSLPSVAIGGRVDGEVAAVLLPLHHPLASIRMECNAVRIESEGLGETLLAGRGAGPAPTAVTLLADLLDIAEGRARIPTAGHPFLAEVAGFADQQAAASRYYLRLAVADRPGTLAQVAGCFASQGISIASLLQPEVPELAGGSLVPLILTTHTTDRGRLDLVLAALAAAGCGRNVVLRIRILSHGSVRPVRRCWRALPGVAAQRAEMSVTPFDALVCPRTAPPATRGRDLALSCRAQPRYRAAGPCPSAAGAAEALA